MKRNRLIVIIVILILLTFFIVMLLTIRESRRISIKEEDVTILQSVIYEADKTKRICVYSCEQPDNLDGVPITREMFSELIDKMNGLHSKEFALVSVNEIMVMELPCQLLTIYAGKIHYYFLLTEDGSIYRLKKVPGNTGVFLPTFVRKYTDDGSVFEMLYSIKAE